MVRSPDADTMYLSSKSTTLTAARCPTRTRRRLMSVGEAMSQTAIERSLEQVTMRPLAKRRWRTASLWWISVFSTSPVVTSHTLQRRRGRGEGSINMEGRKTYVGRDDKVSQWWGQRGEDKVEWGRKEKRRGGMRREKCETKKEQMTKGWETWKKIGGKGEEERKTRWGSQKIGQSERKESWWWRVENTFNGKGKRKTMNTWETIMFISFTMESLTYARAHTHKPKSGCEEHVTELHRWALRVKCRTHWKSWQPNLQTKCLSSCC